MQMLQVWKRNKNLDLWKLYDKYSKGKKFEFEWVHCPFFVFRYCTHKITFIPIHSIAQNLQTDRLPLPPSLSLCVFVFIKHFVCFAISVVFVKLLGQRLVTILTTRKNLGKVHYAATI